MTSVKIINIVGHLLIFLTHFLAFIKTRQRYGGDFDDWVSESLFLSVVVLLIGNLLYFWFKRFNVPIRRKIYIFLCGVLSLYYLFFTFLLYLRLAFFPSI